MFVALVVLALLPMRALAAVAVGDCAVAHHDAAGHTHHDGSGGAHSNGDTHDHEHCASASFLACAALLASPAQTACDRVTRHEPFAAGFVPDHLDPPPLVL